MTFRACGVIGACALLLSACSDKAAPEARPPGDAGKAAAAKVEAILDPAAYPKRKAGLWEQTMSSDGATQTTRFCTDAAVEAKMSVLGEGMSKEACSKIEMKRKLDGSIAFSSVCNMGGQGGVTTSSGLITGDFNSAYKMEITSATEGASTAQMNGSHAMTMQATWKGACPPDFKPGDMEVNGMKFNVAAMAK